jgi:hypothetical protein
MVNPIAQHNDNEPRTLRQQANLPVTHTNTLVTQWCDTHGLLRMARLRRMARLQSTDFKLRRKSLLKFSNLRLFL